jgi:hypothetical protein
MNEFKSAGIIIESNNYYLTKNKDGIYDVLGGKIEKIDNTLFDTAKREAFEESDGKIDLSYDDFNIIKTYVVPEAKYIIYVINSKKYQYSKKEFANVKEGKLEWVNINEIKDIAFNEKERFVGILNNIQTMDYNKLLDYDDDKDNSCLIVPKIFRGIPLEVSYHTLNKIYDLHINRHNDMILLVYKAGMNLWKHNIPNNKYKILLENRGTIYHYNNNNEYELVAFGLEKFWRHDDMINSEVKLIDWKKEFKVQIKYDGFNYKVYYFKDNWYISTNSSIMCDNVILRNSNMNALDAFYQCAKQSGLYFDMLNKNYTYVFELIHPDARLVVPHKEPMLIHIMTRDNKTLKEVDIDIGVKKPVCLNLKSEKEILEYINNLSFEDGEGLILMQESDIKNSPIRIKYKSLSYKREHILLETHMTIIDARIKYISEMWFLNNRNIIEKYHPYLIDTYNYLDSIMTNVQKQYDIMKNYEKKVFFKELYNLNNKFVGRILIKLYNGEKLNKKLIYDDKDTYKYIKKFMQISQI